MFGVLCCCDSLVSCIVIMSMLWFCVRCSISCVLFLRPFMLTCSMFSVFVFRGFVLLVVCCDEFVVLFWVWICPLVVVVGVLVVWVCPLVVVVGVLVGCVGGVCVVGVLFVVPAVVVCVCWGQ